MNFSGEIRALAGCDLLTIGPKFLEELQNTTDPVVQHLSEASGKSTFVLTKNRQAMNEAYI